MATLGNNTTPTAIDNTGSYHVALPITMPAGGGTVTAIAAWVLNDLSASNALIYSVYTDNAGVPGTKVIDTGSISFEDFNASAIAANLVQHSQAVTAPTFMAAGSYHIVVSNAAGSGAPNGHHVGRIASGTLLFQDGTGTPANNSWGTGGDFGSSAGAATAFITYTPSGASAGPTEDYWQNPPVTAFDPNRLVFA